MSLHIMDSVIYGGDFGSPEMREIFEEKSIVEDWLFFEVTLANVQAELGLIPKEASLEIERKGSMEYVKLERIAEIYRQTYLSSVAMIRAFKEVCEGGAGEYIHFGATTQDVFDTTLALRIKKAMNLMENELESIRSKLNHLADAHRQTVMAGRTHGQQALPTTFGFKAAVWSEMISDHLERFKEARKRILVGSVAGALGNYASFYLLGGMKCLEMEKKVLDRLGLRSARVTIQPRIERLTEFMTLLALLAVTFEKIADEIFLLQGNEIGELEEPFDTENQVSSSTMPQKRNPNRCELMKAVSKKIRSNASAFADIYVRQERDHAPFYVEDLIIPETCILASTILGAANFVFKGLIVKGEAMRNNLQITKGLIMTEALMLRLAQKTGRKEEAFAMTHRVAMEAFEAGQSFSEYVLENPDICQHFNEEELREVLDPMYYLGLNDLLIDRIVQG